MGSRVKKIRATVEGNVYFDLDGEAKTYVVKQDSNSFGNVFSLLRTAMANRFKVNVLNAVPDGEYLRTDDVFIT